jgi:hypothetical protein
MARKNPAEMELEEIAGLMGGAQPGSIIHTQMLAELTRRQTVAQLAATEAQKAAAIAEAKAAEAATETARATHSNAVWMFWSVIAAATSAVITALGVAFNAFGNSH